jgi:hypothetical protein
MLRKIFHKLLKKCLLKIIIDLEVNIIIMGLFMEIQQNMMAIVIVKFLKLKKSLLERKKI